MRTVTLDTNTVDDAEIIQMARSVGLDVVCTTVTDREMENSNVTQVLSQDSRISEPLVIGEGRIGSAAVASDETPETLERLLQIISNGSFPPREQRSNKSEGQKRQLRDAIILCTHIKEGRDIFVTNDSKGFIRGGRREQIEGEFGTKIMTSSEFIALCKSMLQRKPN